MLSLYPLDFSVGTRAFVMGLSLISSFFSLELNGVYKVQISADPPLLHTYSTYTRVIY